MNSVIVDKFALDGLAVRFFVTRRLADYLVFGRLIADSSVKDRQVVCYSLTDSLSVNSTPHVNFAVNGSAVRSWVLSSLVGHGHSLEVDGLILSSLDVRSCWNITG